MSTAEDGGAPFEVVIAGGSVGALEATLALRELAGDLVRVTLLAPREDFVYRPMTVQEPFAYPTAQRYPLAEIAADLGAEVRRESFGWVDAEERVAHTDTGEALGYDALLLALGARPYVSLAHVVTVDDRRIDEQLHGLIQDVEGGYVKRLAFVAPGPATWPLPLYELALMTAQRAYETSAELEITLITPEERPLAVFGLGASHAVSKLLEVAGIQMIGSAHVQVPESQHLLIHPGSRRLEVDRIVALPALLGPAIRGLPSVAHGFIPTGPDGRVRGQDRIFAAGDATDFPVKHGGIAAQQADAAAASIAALAGAPVTPEPFHPTIRGMLLTGGRPRYLTARLVGGGGFESQITDEPTWSPPVKIAARHLAPYLDEWDSRAR